jgi:hypothetical protein
MAALTMVVTCGLSARADPPPGKNDAPKPLSKQVVEAWEKAGAEVVWMRVDKFGFPEYSIDEPVAGDLPVFFFAYWEEGLLAKLPEPASPYGLYLYRYDTPLTDVALKELVGLKRLQTLGLGGPHGPQRWGAELKELAKLKALQTLMLRCNRVTDEGLKELAGLKTLQALDLYHTGVTDTGLKELAGLKNLQRLDLRDTSVTVAALKELADLKSLQALNLRNTQVTDASLKGLAGLKKLQTLDLGRTKVTAAGLKELRKALPGCKISR